MLYFGERAIIPTGIAVELPPGCEGQIRPRSSLSKEGVYAALGTIDSDYRGELMVMLHNQRSSTEKGGGVFEIRHGQRIAQLVVARYMQCVVEEVRKLSATERGEKGFGSTGQ